MGGAADARTPESQRTDTRRYDALGVVAVAVSRRSVSAPSFVAPPFKQLFDLGFEVGLQKLGGLGSQEKVEFLADGTLGGLGERERFRAPFGHGVSPLDLNNPELRRFLFCRSRLMPVVKSPKIRHDLPQNPEQHFRHVIELTDKAPIAVCGTLAPRRTTLGPRGLPLSAAYV